MRSTTLGFDVFGRLMVAEHTGLGWSCLTLRLKVHGTAKPKKNGSRIGRGSNGDSIDRGVLTYA